MSSHFLCFFGLKSVNVDVWSVNLESWAKLNKFSSFYSANPKKNFKLIEIMKIWDLPFWNFNNGDGNFTQEREEERESHCSSNLGVLVWFGKVLCEIGESL